MSGGLLPLALAGGRLGDRSISQDDPHPTPALGCACVPAPQRARWSGAKTSSETLWCLIWMVSPAALRRGVGWVTAVTVPAQPLLLPETSKEDVDGHVVSHCYPFPRSLGFQGPLVGGPEKPMDTGAGCTGEDCALGSGRGPGQCRALAARCGPVSFPHPCRHHSRV